MVISYYIMLRIALASERLLFMALHFRFPTTLTFIVTFDVFAKKFLLTVHLKYFIAYIHLDLIVITLELSSMHVDIHKYLKCS
jgi:uncharacterized membrane protein